MQKTIKELQSFQNLVRVKEEELKALKDISNGDEALLENFILHLDVNKELDLAFLEDIAELNNHIAENIMALYYRNKQSYNKEELKSYKEKAFFYWKKSADHLTSCAYNLAECYAKGEGTERDIEKAKIYYKKAADKGSVLSALKLQDLERVKADHLVIPLSDNFAECMKKLGEIEKSIEKPSRLQDLGKEPWKL